MMHAAACAANVSAWTQRVDQPVQSTAAGARAGGAAAVGSAPLIVNTVLDELAAIDDADGHPHIHEACQ